MKITVEHRHSSTLQTVIVWIARNDNRHDSPDSNCWDRSDDPLVTLLEPSIDESKGASATTHLHLERSRE